MNRRIILPFLATLFLTSCGHNDTTIESTTKAQTSPYILYESDEIQVNHIETHDDTISFELLNHSDQMIDYDLHYVLQKKVDSTWQDCTIEEDQAVEDILYHLLPNEQISLTVDSYCELTSGNYRILIPLLGELDGYLPGEFMVDPNLD